MIDVLINPKVIALLVAFLAITALVVYVYRDFKQLIQKAEQGKSLKKKEQAREDEDKRFDRSRGRLRDRMERWLRKHYDPS